MILIFRNHVLRLIIQLIYILVLNKFYHFINILNWKKKILNYPNHPIISTFIQPLPHYLPNFLHTEHTTHTNIRTILYTHEKHTKKGRQLKEKKKQKRKPKQKQKDKHRKKKRENNLGLGENITGERKKNSEEEQTHEKTKRGKRERAKIIKSLWSWWIESWSLHSR